MKNNSKRKPLANTELVRTLIRLLNTSQGKAVDAAGLTRQNVSTWLTGRESSLTSEKKLQMLSSLGVSYQKLRSDMVHRWCIRSVQDVADVLATVVEPSAEVLLWEVDNPELPGSAILRFRQDGELVWLILYRPVMEHKPASITTKDIGFGQFICELPINTKSWKSWLPPAVIDVEKFDQQMTVLISKSSFPLPTSTDDAEELEGDYQDRAPADISDFQPTQKELNQWYALLVRMKMRGLDLDESLNKVKLLLGVKLAGEK